MIGITSLILVIVYLSIPISYIVGNNYFDILLTVVEILIVFILGKKILSAKEMGFVRSGFGRSLIYSLIFTLIVRGSMLLYTATLNPQFYLDLDWVFLTIVLLGTFSEELIFRGIIFKMWGKKFGYVFGFFFSLFLFGVAHMFVPEDLNVNAGLGIPLWAAALGATIVLSPTYTLVYHRTGNLWGIAISHFVDDAVIFFGLIAITTISDPLLSGVMGIVLILLALIYPWLIDVIDGKLYPRKREEINWKKYFLIMIGLIILLTFGMPNNQEWE